MTSNSRRSPLLPTWRTDLMEARLPSKSLLSPATALTPPGAGMRKWRATALAMQPLLVNLLSSRVVSDKCASCLTMNGARNFVFLASAVLEIASRRSVAHAWSEYEGAFARRHALTPGTPHI